MRINPQSAGNYLNEIIELYNAGKSERQVAKQLNITRSKVNYTLTKNLVSKRPSNVTMKPNFNEEFFKVIDTEEKAYWLGFLAADGYVNTKENYMRLELGSKDLEHIKKLCVSINYPEERIKERAERNSYYLHVSSIEFTKHIKNIKDPSILYNIEDHLKPHFVRGFFDGDGSVWYRGKNAIPTAIICTLEMSQVLKDVVPINFNKLTHVKSCDMYRLRTEGIKTSLSFLSYLYDNSTIFLTRKKLKYTSYLTR